MHLKKEMELGGRTLSIEVGKVAKQADGAAWIKYGDTVILATAVSNREMGENTDFFPLTVDYREKMYAVGRIPGGFFKREGRPHTKEILTARLTDRPLRPLFPKGYYHETQVLISVLSHDGENDGDILSVIGASTALVTSDIPFDEAVATVKVGRINGELVLNPTIQQLEECDLDILVAGTSDAIAMVEGEAQEVDESVFIEAIEFAHEAIKGIIKLQYEFVEAIGVEKREWTPFVVSDEVQEAVIKATDKKVAELVAIADKAERKKAQKELKTELREQLAEEFPEQEKQIGWALENQVKDTMRKMVLDKKVRLDGRGLKDVRQITIEAGLLPRVHGSALFTRGQTQSLGTCTLGAKMDEQRIDDLEGNYWKTFMLHYNFPPFCTGEVKRNLSPGRREEGHGHLANRAIKAVLPPWDEFPYTVRIVSEVLESNGSSSMATVCSASLSAMDAGVPLKSPVAGIAMGLIKEGDDYVILSDILGDEDHLGDMDFKVAGSSKGINAFQMDIKIKGLSKQIMAEALAQAKEGREHILGIMNEALPTHRDTLSKYAPRISHIQVDPEDIGLIIGPGGRQIRKLQDEFNVNIEIDDDGMITISSTTDEDTTNAQDVIRMMTQPPEIGSEYDAKVMKITDFGAFCEIFPGKEGLLHISELEWHRVNKVEDVVKVGDSVKVKLVHITDQGKLDLSRKALLPRPEGYTERKPTRRSGNGSGRPPHKKPGGRGPRR